MFHPLIFLGKPFYLLGLLLALMATEPTHLSADAGVTREYTVKGAFLYNFAHFVDWPATAFASDSTPLTIGILGNNPFGSALEKLNGENVKARKILVRSLSNVEEAEKCHLVFICTSEEGHLFQIMAKLQKIPVLTVSDINKFAASGGIIQFITLEDKIRFEINLKQAQASNLTLSSKLLKLARDVIK